MNFHDQNQTHYASMAEGFMTKVYGWMCAGLTVSAGVAYYMLSNVSLIHRINSSLGLMIALFVAMFGIIMFLSSQFQKLSYPVVGALYLAFALIQGIFLTPVLLMYTSTSVVNVFVTAALMFIGMAIYGSVTKSDLSSMGNLLMMAMWGLVVSMIVNIFLQSSAFSMLISAVSVGVFAMLVAYDVQNLKKLSQHTLMTPQDTHKFAIMGALNLYLNMINLFLHLLRLFGERRD